MVAALSLRVGDVMHLAELHPQEHAALLHNLSPWGAHVQKRDGFDMALAVCPPTPRRGLMLIDPSYEVKSDYDRTATVIAQLHRKWNVGVILLWYPLLTAGLHCPMLAELAQAFPTGLRSEVRFARVREGHRMEGSGLLVVNPPYGMADEAARIAALFRANAG
jgi:23S rRNA (adenine2030-N6)-methyltransferase